MHYRLFSVMQLITCFLSFKPFITYFKILWCFIVNVDPIFGVLVTSGTITQCRSCRNHGPTSTDYPGRKILMQTTFIKCIVAICIATCPQLHYSLHLLLSLVCYLTLNTQLPNSTAHLP